MFNDRLFHAEVKINFHFRATHVQRQTSTLRRNNGNHTVRLASETCIEFNNCNKTILNRTMENVEKSITAIKKTRNNVYHLQLKPAYVKLRWQYDHNVYGNGL